MFIINQDNTKYRGEDDPGHESLYGDIARGGNGGRMMEIHPHVVSLVKEGIRLFVCPCRVLCSDLKRS